MTYKEEKRDLFMVGDDYYLAHCISADFKLGAGIAVEFVKRFDMRDKLFKLFPNGYEVELKHYKINADSILVDRVINLVTKMKYYQKPTYETMKTALSMMKLICTANNIKKVAMPKIGCGLDRLNWDKVSALIHEIFNDTDIEILVCIQ